jgi:hypothetical protein
MWTHLKVPEMGRQIVCALPQLKRQDLVHAQNHTTLRVIDTASKSVYGSKRSPQSTVMSKADVHSEAL